MTQSELTLSQSTFAASQEPGDECQEFTGAHDAKATFDLMNASRFEVESNHDDQGDTLPDTSKLTITAEDDLMDEQLSMVDNSFSQEVIVISAD